ncbi:hypothetical protein R1flu_013699 [Riccia fluitans]|uniref:Uncharacterized protein n=1 Tax=Riccia fluitans TaxID=41844 RepID=A0ABD1YE04_9MARC
MSRNIHLYHLRGNEQSMISMGLIGFKEGDTLLSLRQKLEGIRIFESAFQFWDSRLGSQVHTKLKALIFVEDLEGKVVLFETKDSEESNLVLVGPRVKIEPPVIGTQPVERNVIYKEQNEGIVDVSIGSSKPSVIGDDRLEGKAESLDLVFRDKFPRMALPLHLLGSDLCEQFISRVGGMKGYERNYDFEDLLDCVSGLNHLAVLEYGEDFIKLSKAHVKHRPLWTKLHPLPPSHVKPDLSDFARLATDDQIIEALKVGLQ